MRLLLTSLLLVSLAACGPEADAPSTAGSIDDPVTDPPVVVDAAPDAPEANPEPQPIPVAASGPTTYECASGETITLEEIDGSLRYTLADRTVDLAPEADGRYATEAMWVEIEEGRVTVTRDEDSTLDCTAP